MKECADAQVKHVRDNFSITEIKCAVDKILNLAAKEQSTHKKELFISFAIICKESVL